MKGKKRRYSEFESFVQGIKRQNYDINLDLFNSNCVFSLQYVATIAAIFLPAHLQSLLLSYFPYQCLLEKCHLRIKFCLGRNEIMAHRDGETEVITFILKLKILFCSFLLVDFSLAYQSYGFWLQTVPDLWKFTLWFFDFTMVWK